MKDLNITQQRQLGIFTRFLKRNYKEKNKLAKDSDELKSYNGENGNGYDFFTLMGFVAFEIKGLNLEEDNENYIVKKKENEQEQIKKEQVDFMNKVHNQFVDDSYKESKMTIKELKDKIDNYADDCKLQGELKKMVMISDYAFVNKDIVKQIHNLFHRFNQKKFSISVGSRLSDSKTCIVQPLIFKSDNFRILVMPIAVGRSIVKECKNKNILALYES